MALSIGVALAIGALGDAAAVRDDGGQVRIIVRETPGHDAEARASVARLGGRIGSRLRIVDGFVADMPLRKVPVLRYAPGVLGVSPDVSVRLSGSEDDAVETPATSMTILAETVGATELWDDHITGSGIDVALIDSGVTPVDGLASAGKIVNGPDLSFDRQAGAPPYLDTFGHGTHLASVIAGRDQSIDHDDRTERGHFSGIAPGARIISVKVASAGGQTDVSQVIAAIDWVVQHRASDGLNIRVLNLSFGTDGTQDYALDPLAYAVEVAWRQGLVVVTAAGNDGERRRQLANPALDPFVVAVGAVDTLGTLQRSDDTLPAWSSPGDAARHPDLVAPGVAVPGLRVNGSFLDLATPSASGSRFLRGSGTSEAAAVVSGAAALLLQDRPQMTPDQVKALLVSTARSVPNADRTAQGAGLLDIEEASEATIPTSTQRWTFSSGTGSLEGARGTVHIEVGTSILHGESDIFGAGWDARRWARESLDGTSWDGGMWNGNLWSGDCLCASSESGPAWSGLSWSGLSWSGLSWSGLSWSGLSWSGLSWSGLSWSTITWSSE